MLPTIIHDFIAIKIANRNPSYSLYINEKGIAIFFYRGKAREVIDSKGNNYTSTESIKNQITETF